MKAIIIGATSGIGRELAQQMSTQGYELGITGRRSHLLDTLAEVLPAKAYKATMDLEDVQGALKAFKQLLETMGGVDLVVINSGTGSNDPKFPLEDELSTVAVNVLGFTAIANVAYHYFVSKGQGHIVGISSIAAVRGGPAASYNASKAYVSSYLEGLACRAHVDAKDISITDIRPGFVDTAMAKGEGIFWCAPVPKAAQQILTAIKNKRSVVYVTKRWRLIAILLACLPGGVYRKLMG